MERLFSYGFLALPTVFITFALVGALLALRWRRSGTALALAASLCLFVAATPVTSGYLIRRVEADLPRTPDLHEAQAIVVLSGDVQRGNGDDVPDTLGPLTLQRVVFAAAAYRRLHLPVAVSGGRQPGEHTNAAELMKAALEGEFAVPVRWSENRSRTTWENAVFTARLLQPAGINTVLLISQAWALPRALWAFERVGLKALPWPAARAEPQPLRVEDFLPNAGGLQDSFFALHEMVGAVYYRLRH